MSEDKYVRNSWFQSLLKFLSAPQTIIGGTVLGAACGFFFPDFSKSISLGGELYLSYLSLMAIPLMLCAISSSIAGLISQNQTGTSSVSLKKMALLLAGFLLMFGILGLFTELAVTYFIPNQIKAEQLDELIHGSKDQQADHVMHIFEDSNDGQVQQNFSLRSFIVKSMPTNIFESLSHGNSLHILIFSVLFGLALGMLSPKMSQNMIALLSANYQACLYLIHCSMYVLPIGLFCMMANIVAVMDYSLWNLISKYMIIIVSSDIVMLAAGLFFWSRTARISMKELLIREGKVLLLAFSSRQSFLVMPLLIQDMEKKFHYSQDQLKLVVPFAVTMGKYNSARLMIMTVVFISTLYYGSVSWSVIPAALLLAPLIAISGSWPVSIAVLLKILSIPDELGLILMLAINSFEDSLATMVNVTYNALFTTMIVDKNMQPQSEITGKADS